MQLWIFSSQHSQMWHHTLSSFEPTTRDVSWYYFCSPIMTRKVSLYIRDTDKKYNQKEKEVLSDGFLDG